MPAWFVRGFFIGVVFGDKVETLLQCLFIISFFKCVVPRDQLPLEGSTSAWMDKPPFVMVEAIELSLLNIVTVVGSKFTIVLLAIEFVGPPFQRFTRWLSELTVIVTPLLFRDFITLIILPPGMRALCFCFNSTRKEVALLINFSIKVYL